MEKSSVKKQKKYGIPFIGIACILFLIAAFVLYFVTADDHVSYYYEDNSELTLVSASPAGSGGVSQDRSIVLEWNRPVSLDLADDITIHPSARGKWSVSGNQLIFTPQQLAAGTYYTVFVPRGKQLNERGDILKEDVFFSFETEDPELRLPDQTAFSVVGRSFTFTPEESALIPVSLIDEKNRTVEVSLFRAESSEAFIDAFAEVFAYPSWAELSIADYRVSERNFNEIFSRNITVQSGDGVSAVDLGVLPEGQYLAELSADGSRYDVAVTVSDVSLGMVCDHGVFSAWGRYGDEPYADAEIQIRGKGRNLDENGFISVPYTYDLRKIDEDPASLGVTVAGKKEDVVFFLTADDVAPVYDGDLFLDRKQLSDGGSLMASGAVFSESGVPVNDDATLLLCSEVGIVESVDVSLENGFFSHQWEALSLTAGEYRLVLLYHGKTLASDTVTVGKDDHELRLYVSKSADRVLRGESVTYRAYLCDAAGQPVTDAVISMNGEDGVAVDKKGNAVFRKTYEIGNGFISVQKDVVFRVSSPYGDAAEVTSSVLVYGSSRAQARQKAVLPGDSADVALPLVLNGQRFAVAGEDDTPTFRMVYDDNGTYDMEAVATAVTFDFPRSVAVNCGETIALSEEAESVSRRITAVSLYAGMIPESLCDKNLYNENLHDHIYGTLEETRVFFGNEKIDAAFSSENRNGDYFIRVVSKDFNGNTVSRYIPVTVNGVTLSCPQNASYAYGRNVKLPFYVDTDEELEYRLTVGETEYRDTVRGDFSVSVAPEHTGSYGGEIQLLKGDAVVASEDFSFSVYKKTPLFFTVTEGYQKDGFLYCQVRKNTAASFLTAFRIMALPGDQILQRMGKTLFYQTVGDEIGKDFSDYNFDLTSLQNSDGGFGRFDGAESDLLLSVLVAEQEEFVCDRASLCTYLKYRLTTADNPETAALACWGLSCFDYDCSESMSMIKDRSERVLLYLAEGYEAAGNKAEAMHIYGQLERELREDDGKIYLPKSDDQYSIANTAFMMDLALKLNQGEASGLLEFLMSSDIKMQTGRYLLLSGILRMTEADDIAPVRGEKADRGYVLLSFVAEEHSNLPMLNTQFTQNGETVGSVHRGEAAEMNIQWEKTDNNSIYLVYIGEPKGVSVIEKDGVIRHRGYYEQITDTGAATISFCAESAGENVAPRVYVINLTSGEVVGVADGKGWKVKK